MSIGYDVASKTNQSPLVASAAVRSKVVVVFCLFFVYCRYIGCGICVRTLFCYTVLCVLSTFSITLLERRKMVALLFLFDVIWLSLFFASLCRGLVVSV